MNELQTKNDELKRRGAGRSGLRVQSRSQGGSGSRPRSERSCRREPLPYASALLTPYPPAGLVSPAHLSASPPPSGSMVQAHRCHGKAYPAPLVPVPTVRRHSTVPNRSNVNSNTPRTSDGQQLAPPSRQPSDLTSAMERGQSATDFSSSRKGSARVRPAQRKWNPEKSSLACIAQS